MNKPVDESVMRKVRKALNLAQKGSGATEGEAQAAMLLAQRIMAQHGLSMSDVQDVNIDPANATKKEVVHGFGTEREKKVWWKGRLADVIGNNFRCFTYFTTYGKGTNATMRVRFLGIKEDVDLAIEVFQYAVEIIEYHARRYVKSRKKELADNIEMIYGIDFGTDTNEELEKTAYENGVDLNEVQDKYGHEPKTYRMRLIMAIKEALGATVDANGMKNDYIQGFINGLRDKFSEQVKKEGWGLVLVKDGLVEQEFNNMALKDSKPSTAKASGDAAARQAGYKQGKSFGTPKGKLQGGKLLN